MTRDEVLETIRIENLRRFNWFDAHEVEPDEVGIRQHDNTWSVYTASERATPMSVKVFESESAALENFLKRLRASNELQKLYKRDN